MNKCRYLRTPEQLSALRVAKQTLRIRNQKICRMKICLESIISENSVEADSNVNEEIEKAIKEHSMALPKSDFKRVFWDQLRFCFCIINTLYTFFR